MKVRILLVSAACLAASLPAMAQSLPSKLSGTWRITHVLSSSKSACWSAKQADPLVGSTLTYRSEAMRWKGGEVPLEDVYTRTVSAAEFRKENATQGAPPDFAQLGIHGSSVTEVDLQHDDAYITGATTEVPGDSVLLVAPNRIVVSACGVYFAAVRGGGSELRASAAIPRRRGMRGTSLARASGR